MNRTIKVLIFLALAHNATTGAIVLQSSVIKLLDGVWPAFDGDTFYKMSWLIVKMDAMINGKIIDKTTKERQGLYTFDGKLYCVRELAEIEKNNLPNKDLQERLQEVLKAVKTEFIDINKVFIKQIQGQKQFVVKIMQESCDRHGVPDSFMLRWADTPFGQEEESFDKNMKTFADLNKFLIELRNFLGDLFESCPKGYAQYLEVLKKQKAIAKG